METLTMPRKSKRKVLQDETPKEVTAAGNGEVDVETFLSFLAKIKRETARKAAVAKRVGAVWKMAINAGIRRQDLEAVLKVEDMDPKVVAENFARQKRYAEWMDVPFGKQITIHDIIGGGSSIPNADERAKRAYYAGLYKGAAGDDPDTQAYAPDHENFNDMMAGWRAGQKTLTDKIKTLDPQLDEVEDTEFKRRMKMPVVAAEDDHPDPDATISDEERNEAIAMPMEG